MGKMLHEIEKELTFLSFSTWFQTSRLLSIDEAAKTVIMEVKTLSEIVIEMLASLNSLNKEKDRLIEIVADGKIEDDELHDFAGIKMQLEHLSLTVDSLQLWVNQTIASGAIDKEKLDAICGEMKK